MLALVSTAVLWFLLVDLVDVLVVVRRRATFDLLVGLFEGGTLFSSSELLLVLLTACLISFVMRSPARLRFDMFFSLGDGGGEI